MQTLIIDHYDSFTYNLFQLVAEIQNKEPIVISHDSEEYLKLDPGSYDNIILSPGPGHPEQELDFSIGKSIILHSDKPILGVCLGHQGIFSILGGQISRAVTPMHGRLSSILHNHSELYTNIPSPFQVMRYHSLLCTGSLPPDLELNAWTAEGLIMGFRHKHKPIWGIQYHPESIASEYGRQLFLNFQQLTVQHYQQRGQILPSQNVSRPMLRPSATKPSLPRQDWRLLTHAFPFASDPANVFQKLFAQITPALWLDSSQIISGFSRFSYMGAPQSPNAYSLSYNAQTQIVTKTQGQVKADYPVSIFAYLKHALSSINITLPQSLPFDFHGGFIGYFGYELNRETAQIPNGKIPPHPDAHWVFLDQFLVFDHQEQICYLVAISPPDYLDMNRAWIKSTHKDLLSLSESAPTKPAALKLSGTWAQPTAAYMERIQDCLNYIAAGDSYEICLTNKLQFFMSIDPLQYYLNLRHCHPAPHAAFFQFDQLAIACSSMERFLKLDAQRQIQSKPIKGTLPRDQDPHQDQALAHQLQTQEKFRSEHVMIVDLLRNDLGKICQIGSITVPILMQVESYATVHQLVSVITGELLPELDIIDCIQQTFPGGSMTGAPKIRAMTLLNQFETQARGIYSGSLGYLSLSGTADLNIVIRTAEITPKHISMGAGGAIIALSDPAEELAEMLLKTRALQTALAMTLQNQDVDILQDIPLEKDVL